MLEITRISVKSIKPPVLLSFNLPQEICCNLPRGIMITLIQAWPDFLTREPLSNTYVNRRAALNTLLRKFLFNLFLEDILPYKKF